MLPPLPSLSRLHSAIAVRARHSSQVEPVVAERSQSGSEPVRVGLWTWVGLAAALALYIGLRVMILRTHFDAVCMPNYELGTIGNLSKVILEGNGGAAPAVHFDNGGGHVAVGWMAVPFYALFGSTYLSLKLVPFTLGVLTLLLVARLLCVHYRPLAAVLFAFMLAVAPPTLTKYSLIAKGNHFENLFFQFLAITAFFELHTRARKQRWLVITGLAGGIAVSFYFGALLTLLLLAIVHFIVRGARQSVRDLGWAVPAFLAGLIPLLWLDIDSGGRGRNFLWTRLWENAEGELTGVGARLASFIGVTLPEAGCFEDFGHFSGRCAGYIFLVCFVGAWASGVYRLWRAASDADTRTAPEGAHDARRFERWKSLPFLLHLPAMMVFVSAFDFPFKPYEAPVEVGQYRYLVPHFAFACVLIAIESAAWIHSSRKLARAAGAGLGGATLLTGLCTLPIIDSSPEQAGRGSRYEGYWFPYYSHVLLRDLPWDTRRIEHELSGFDAMYQRQSYFGVAFLMAWKNDLDRQGRGEPDSLGLPELLSPFESRFSIDLARGGGSYLRLIADQGPRGHERLKRILDDLVRTNEPYASYAAEGLALDYQFPIARRSQEFLLRGVQLRSDCPTALRPALERGIGIACGRLIPRGIVTDLTCVHRIELRTPEEHRENLAFGMGWGAADASDGKPLTTPFWHLLPPGRERAALEGFGAGLRHTYGAEESRRIFSSLRSGFSGENESWVKRGLDWPNYPEPYVLTH